MTRPSHEISPQDVAEQAEPTGTGAPSGPPPQADAGTSDATTPPPGSRPDPGAEGQQPVKTKKRKKKAAPSAPLPKPGALRRALAFIQRHEGKTWAVAILSILLVELYVFGKNGSIRVCVGKQGVTDFSLQGKPITDSNRRQVPFCETRYNVGMRSHYEERLKEATYLACRKATIVSGIEERAACFGSMQPWVKDVDVTTVAPWEDVFYKNFLWFLF